MINENILIIISIALIFIMALILIINIGKYKNKINNLNKNIFDKEENIKNINSELTKYKNELSEKESDYNKVKTELEETNIKLEEKEETINNHKKAIDKHKKVLDILSDRPEKNEQTEAFDKMRIVYNDLINKCIEYDLPSGKLFKNFDELLEKIEDAINFPLFYHKNIIALCGQFSSGKTSMINSFLKDNILPTSIEPTTAINTFVINDEEEGLYIRNCFSGKTKVDYDFVTHTFTKEYDKDVHSMVKYASLHTQKLKYENIALLDTPGYTGQGQDATEDDSNMAMKGIAQADNIIWVVSMENGTIRLNDLDFLEKEELNGKDILIVFNKADVQSEEDIDKIVEESKSLLDSRGIDYKDIVVYSSKYPEDYKEGESKLFNFFERENNSIERNYLEDLNKIFNEFKKYYEDMDGDLSDYTAALNIAKIKGFLDSGIRKDKSIDESLKNVNQNRTIIKNFIMELENSKNKCLDLLGESLYNRKREEYNKHIRNLSK
ncbi:dynamin family protein [Brachyspira aalborgi]|uniref:dynamin family protein n=1 Tax=Brachyspira aalborgi TaxID=29522 RepID=UPI002665A2E6|nr:dynamin family protein [Brachyspira aalborgi]